MDGMIILTPWKCPELRVRNGVYISCDNTVLEDGVIKCPHDSRFLHCCYMCQYNEDCCDRCEHLTVDEGHIKEQRG